MEPAAGIDWTTIIVTLISVITSGGLGILATLKYTKNKAKTEANSAANQEQSERIDLGDKYVNQMLSMLEKIQEASNKNIALTEDTRTERMDVWENVKVKMDRIHDDLVSVKTEVTGIVQYLNGGYRAYKDEHPELAVFEDES